MFETEVLNGLLRVGGGGEGSWICAPINKTNLAGKQCLLDIKPNFLDQFQGKVIQLAEIIRELIMISERLMIQQLNDMQLHVLLRSTSTVRNTYFVFLVLSPMSVTKQEDVCLHFITKLKICHLSYSVCAHDA